MPPRYVKRLIDKLISLQDRFYSDIWPYLRQGKGNVALLRVVGEGGDNVLLKCNGEKITYAEGNEKVKHILTCSIDTFLRILANEETVREAVTKRHFVIENAETNEIDLVELQKWASTFERMRHLLKKVGLK